MAKCGILARVGLAVAAALIAASGVAAAGWVHGGANNTGGTVAAGKSPLYEDGGRSG